MHTPYPKLFDTKRLPPQRQQELATLYQERHKTHLTTVDEAAEFLRRVLAPPSFRWTFCGNGKAASTSTLQVLFALEFRTALTVGFDLETSINGDPITHRMVQADVLRPVLGCRLGLAHMEKALRVCTVRHPLPRAVSGFRFLCLSDSARAQQFHEERLRMNAAVGFDWHRDPLTSRGFVKFLEFLKMSEGIKIHFGEAIHWRPQSVNIRPSVYRPQLIGKVEDFAAFALALCEHLGKLPTGIDAGLLRNAQPPFDPADLLSDPAALDLVREIFSSDFEAFGYDLLGTPGTKKGYLS